MSLATGEMAMAVTHPHYGRNAFNPVTTWRHLSIAAGDRVGPAALTLLAGMLGSMANLGPGNAFAAAETEALDELAEIAVDGLPDIFGQVDGSLPQPLLAPLGFTSCRLCGFTPRCACDEGCGWSEVSVCAVCRNRLAPRLARLADAHAVTTPLLAAPERPLRLVSAGQATAGVAFVVCETVDASLAAGDDWPLPQIAGLGFALDLDDLGGLDLVGGSFLPTWTMSFGRMASSPGAMTERNPGSAGGMAAR